MPKFSKPLFITLAVLYFLFLVVSQIPAGWVAYTAHKSVPNLWLTGVTGSAWKGLARGAQLDLGKNTQIPMGPVNWEISPWSMLLLSPCIEFQAQFAGRPFDGRVCYGISGSLKISDLTLEAPADAFAELIPIKAGGMASLNIIDGKMNGELKVSNLEGQLTVQGVRINPGDGWMQLGTFAATLGASENGELTAKVIDIDAPFAVDMDVSWAVGTESVKANGTIKPGDNAPGNAVAGIQILGEEVDTGVYHIQWP